MKLNTKALLCVTLVFVTATIILADTAAPKKLKPWQRKRGTGGGLVIQEVPGPHLKIVNAQTKVSHEKFEEMAFELSTSVILPWKAVQVAAAADAQAVARAALAGGAAGVVAVVDSPSLRRSLRRVFARSCGARPRGRLEAAIRRSSHAFCVE